MNGKARRVQLDNSFSWICTSTVGSLINESACGDIINFYDSSRYLCAFGVYSRHKGARTKPRMVERKVAQTVDIFSTAVGWKLLFLLAVQQFVLAYASRTHINARSPDIFSIHDIAQRANRIRKPFSSLFVARWVHIRVAFARFFASFTSLRDCIFL